MILIGIGKNKLNREQKTEGRRQHRRTILKRVAVLCVAAVMTVSGFSVPTLADNGPANHAGSSAKTTSTTTAKAASTADTAKIAGTASALTASTTNNRQTLTASGDDYDNDHCEGAHPHL